MIERWAGLVSLVGGLCVIAVFVAVMRGARHAVPDGNKVVYRVRRYYAWVLGVAIAVALVVTLPRAPYAAIRSIEPAMHVAVVGHMWSWEINVPGAAPGAPVVLPLGREIAFDVTSADVNHGFGIYDASGAIVAQTQAMPGYTNRLQHTFDTPGRYHILCLEYCGLAHHAMMTELEIR